MLCLVVVYVFVPSTSYAGVTVTGLSGTMIVPGIELLPPGGARASTSLIGSKDWHEGAFKGVFAFSDDSEVGILKKFSKDGRLRDDDPVISAKYRVRPNVAMAAVIDTNEDYKHSMMLVTGIPGNKVVLGVGANFGFTDHARHAHFGRYEYEYAKVDPLFFMLGAKLNIDADTLLTMDYAGNDFVIGLRHAMTDRVALDFGYYTPDRLNGTSRYILGANFGF